MIFKRASRLLLSALIAGIVAFPIGVSIAHAQDLAMDTHFIVESAKPSSTMPERIVLHGVHFRGRSDKIDKSSVAILNYAAETLRQNPRSILCVAVLPARSATERYQAPQDELTERREQAVIGYLEQRGVDTERLVFVFRTVA